MVVLKEEWWLVRGIYIFFAMRMSTTTKKVSQKIAPCLRVHLTGNIKEKVALRGVVIILHQGSLLSEVPLFSVVVFSVVLQLYVMQYLNIICMHCNYCTVCH